MNPEFFAPYLGAQFGENDYAVVRGSVGDQTKCWKITIRKYEPRVYKIEVYNCPNVDKLGSLENIFEDDENLTELSKQHIEYQVVQVVVDGTQPVTLWDVRSPVTEPLEPESEPSTTSSEEEPEEAVAEEEVEEE